jgi:dihydroorotate dehydrogenase
MMAVESPAWRLAKKALFTIDAERIHHVAMSSLSAWSRWCSLPTQSDIARDPRLQVLALGLQFPNPLGLAAGFDKDARCIPAWQALGFGFVEVGTVTRHAQPGNDKPRLFRLPADGALLNRLGFNNQGADAAARTIEGWRNGGRIRVPLGVNIGKSKVTPGEDAAADYAYSFASIADGADYVAVNVSSPNTPGLRDLQRIDELERLLTPLLTLNTQRQQPRPIVVKIAPDLADEDAIACASLAKRMGVAGFVVSNTTIARTGLTGPIPEGPGGISGRPVRDRSTALLRLLHQAEPSLSFIGVGGIETAADVIDKRRAGASLVQAYTGFVYGGPSWPRRLLSELAADIN